MIIFRIAPLFKTKNKIVFTALSLLFLAIFLIFVVNYVEIKASERSMMDNMDELQSSQVAIIFGAKVTGDMLSPMYADRVVSALNLYHEKKIEKILISGDHGRSDYNEIDVVKEYLLSNNVPAEDIFTDYAGFDTYDTIYRAKEIFKVDSAILVTQRFHLYRAIYIAQNLGMEVSGYEADLHLYKGSEIFETREIFARVKAYVDVVLKVKPKYLGSEIPITGDGRSSWDK